MVGFGLLDLSVCLSDFSLSVVSLQCLLDCLLVYVTVCCPLDVCLLHLSVHWDIRWMWISVQHGFSLSVCPSDVVHWTECGCGLWGGQDRCPACFGGPMAGRTFKEYVI
jgi:hypothetical protein